MTYFSTKVAQILDDFLGFLERHNFYGKTAMDTFGQFLDEFEILFISRSGHTASVSPLNNLNGSFLSCLIFLLNVGACSVRVAAR